MLFRKGVIGLLVGLLLILSCNGQALAPVSADFGHQLIEDDHQTLENAQLVVDGISLGLNQLLNSEIPVFNIIASDQLPNGVAKIDSVEKRVNLYSNNAEIGLQFLNAAVDKTNNSFALRFTGEAQCALVVTAPEVDIVNDYVTEVTTVGQGMKRVCFLLDLESINGRVELKGMRRINFPGKTGDFTFLVSGEAPLQKGYVPTNLVSIPASVPAHQSKSDMKLNSQAVYFLDKLLSQARNEGIGGFVLSSTYRTYSYQSMLFANKVKQLGSESKAAKIVARPGTSEHQSGLAIDFSANGTGLSESFASTPQGRWLGKNAWRYGFILRYPANKTNITKIIYEPWHFRYVGYPYSKIIHDRHLCLEEFVANLKAYGFYVVSDENSSYLCVFNPSDGKVYLSEAIPRNQH